MFFKTNRFCKFEIKALPQWPKNKRYVTFTPYCTVLNVAFQVSVDQRALFLASVTPFFFLPSAVSTNTPAMELAWRHKDRGEKERAREAAWHTDQASRLIFASKMLSCSCDCADRWAEDISKYKFIQTQRNTTTRSFVGHHPQPDLCIQSTLLVILNPEFCDSGKTSLISVSS